MLVLSSGLSAVDGTPIEDLSDGSDDEISDSSGSSDDKGGSSTSTSDNDSEGNADRPRVSCSQKLIFGADETIER